MKKYWIRRHPILTLFLILLLPLMLRGGLNYSGFCWAEKRWLSDEERIDIAIESIISFDEAWIWDGVDGSKYYKIVPFKSVKEFKQKNPNCCEIKYIPDITHYPFLDAVTGAVCIWIPEVSGTVTYLHKGKQYVTNAKLSRAEEGSILLHMSNCGKILTPQELDSIDIKL